jgi:hypothetical protein
METRRRLFHSERNRGLNFFSATDQRVAHISRVFREMWETRTSTFIAHRAAYFVESRFYIGACARYDLLTPASLIAFPAPARFANRISEYFRESTTPCAPARRAAAVAA